MKNYYINILLIGLFFCLGLFSASGQNLDGKITSIFIYNFTKYIKWPSGTETGDFVIGIMGETPAEVELQKLAAKVKINGNRTMVIRKISGVNATAVRSCHILYISRKESRSVKEIATIVGNAPVLLVSEGMGMANKGSTISIYIDDDTDKLRLELNKKELEHHQMKASSELLSLAVVL